MASSNTFLHRSRRIAARSIGLGRRVLAELRQRSEIEVLMDSLPVVQTAETLKGKVVIITGSTQGIGLAVARAFAAKGARLVINGRREEAVATAVERLKKEGADVTGVTADAATPEGAARLVAAATDAFGTLDILVNNAAVPGAFMPAWKVPVDDLQETIRINLTGPALCAAAAARWFVENGKPGRVVNVSTIATEGSYRNMASYSATKAGLEALTRAMAADLPAADVVVTAIILPSVQTERKFANDWASTELLPPAESLVPAFEHAATGPANLLHGRVFSAARFISEPEAEAALAGIASVRKQILYPEIVIDGEKVERDPCKLTLLDRAENQYGTSKKVLDVVRESLVSHSPAYYPDERFSSLKQALAEEYSLEPENFALGPGSWELIDRIVRLFAKPGEEVVSSGPGWFGFNFVCQRHGVAQRLVEFDRGMSGNTPSHNLADVRRAITPSTRLVYLISPSNPEGVVLHHREVQEFLNDLPPELPVMIDEAYAEYADDPDIVDVAALVRDGSRSVIGLRTFSKFYGLAGLRVGHAYARPGLAELIRRQEHIFTVSHLGAVAAEAALADKEHRRTVVEAAREAREQMHRGLSEIGINHILSQAPYIMADALKDHEAMVDELARNGIVVARYRFHGDKKVMLPVGTQEQNAQLLAALRRYL